MLSREMICGKPLLNGWTAGGLTLVRRSLATKIPRGQDPEVVDAMPVFQFTATDSMPAKRKKRIYCWGYSGGGALGYLGFIRRKRYRGLPPLPAIEVKRAPMRMAFVDAVTNVTDVAAGYGFTVIAASVKDSTHQVFGCGMNTDSQIGYHEAQPGKPLINLAQPVPVPLPIHHKSKVIRVACGRSHTICLTSDNQVFTLGNNSFGQCGRPIVVTEKYFASRRIHQIQGIDGRVTDVVCGQDHTLFLTEDGCVYSCGWGADGQTGLGHYKSTSTPTKVKGDIDGQKIVSLSSAADSVLALSESGDLFGWGNSEYCQLSSATRDQQLSIPRRLALNSVNGKIISAAAGGTACAVVNDNGEVYVWGYGILGKGPAVEEQRTPSMLPMPLFGRNEFNTNVKVTRVEAGIGHFAAITNKGDMFMWGKNKSSCLGLFHQGDQYFPLRVCIPAFVKKVSLGIDHTVIIGTSMV